MNDHSGKHFLGLVMDNESSIKPTTSNQYKYKCSSCDGEQLKEWPTTISNQLIGVTGTICSSTDELPD